MKAIILLVATLMIASADLGKDTRFDGVEGLNIQDYYGSVGAQMYEIDDHNGCDESQCNGGQAANVYQVDYDDGHSVHVCTCPDAVTDANDIAYNFGYVPDFIRQYTNFITSASPDTCTNIGAAYSTGDSTTFCQGGLVPSAYVHEAAHNYDFGSGGLSDRQEWTDAINNDSCVPDGYANTNNAEDFAEVAVVWMYISAVSDDIGCMQNQMNTFQSFIP